MKIQQTRIILVTGEKNDRSGYADQRINTPNTLSIQKDFFESEIESTHESDTLLNPVSLFFRRR